MTCNRPYSQQDRPPGTGFRKGLLALASLAILFFPAFASAADQQDQEADGTGVEASLPPAPDSSAVWETSVGALATEHHGKIVTGFFLERDMRIVARMVGDDRALGVWVSSAGDRPCLRQQQGSHYWGRVILNDFSTDYLTLYWSRCDQRPGQGGFWRGVRRRWADDPALAARSPDGGWQWDSANGEILLQIRGDRAEGQVGNATSRLVARREGNTLTGFWITPEGQQSCTGERLGSRYWGRFVLTGLGQPVMRGWRSVCDQAPLEGVPWNALLRGFPAPSGQ